MHQRVLITGTTSGIGKALLVHYASQGTKVIAINRRQCHELMDWDIEQHVIDIANYDHVFGLLKSLKAQDAVPDLFVLNAGINRADNLAGLHYATFAEVMRTNLFGVMTFVGAIKELGITGRTVSTLSSTSNTVPNPAHIGYAVSKRALHQSFELLGKNDPHNHYQSVVLSPVHTSIMLGSPRLKGLQAKIFDLLAVSADTTAVRLAKFFSTKRQVLYFTKTGCLFYWAVSLLLKLVPGLYRGTRPESDSPWNLTQART